MSFSFTLACLLAATILAVAPKSVAAERQLQSAQLDKAIASVYGRFSINPDFVVQQECCSFTCRYQRPGPQAKYLRDCHSTVNSDSSAAGDMRRNFRLESETRVPVFEAKHLVGPADPATPANLAQAKDAQSQVLSREISDRVVDFVHPGFGRWETTTERGTHFRVSFLNVKRCRGRDTGHQDICVGINLAATY